MQNLFAVIELSRGARWKPAPSEPPYLIAQPGEPFPDDSMAYVVFYDTAGSVLVTVDCEVTPQAIEPEATPDEVALIPHGARFEVYLDSDGVDQIRHGIVTRREAPFLEQPPTPMVTTALLFTDSFPTLGLRSSWKPVLNRVKIYDRAGSVPNAMGTDFAFFDKGAVRWETPLNSDSPRMHARLVTSGGGKTTAIVCADQRFSTGLGVQFDTLANTVHLGLITDPITLVDKITPVSQTLVTLTDYYITYSDVSKTLGVYAGTSLTPLATWFDADGEVPHGLGYRYVGFSWRASLLATGPRVCAFGAKDDV